VINVGTPIIDRLEILSEIERLKGLELKYEMEENLDDLIKTAELINNLARDGDFPGIIEDQEKFVRKQLKKQKKTNKKIALIKHVKELSELYDRSIENGLIVEAHETLKDFKDNYVKNSNLSSIPEAKDLIVKDLKIWVKFMEN